MAVQVQSRGDLDLDPRDVELTLAPLERAFMLPPAAFADPAVLGWELEHLFGGWICLGHASSVSEPGEYLMREIGGSSVFAMAAEDGTPRAFLNACRHRGARLVEETEGRVRRRIRCPYHAWSYDLGGRVIAVPAFRGAAALPDSGLVELPVAEWHGWVFAHALHQLGSPEVPDFEEYVGRLGRVLAPYRPELLHAAARHTYEVTANWKVIAENYHECYHCPQIHPELCAVSPPTSGRNYNLPGAWVGGSLELREGMATMSLDGRSGGRPIPGAPAGRVEFVHLMPNLLVSAHPDYVMTHRLVPLSPDRTWVECTWLMPDGVTDASYAVDFWDLTNRQDWAACESVQRGTANPHFTPGPLAPNEDALVRFTELVQAAYV